MNIAEQIAHYATSLDGRNLPPLVVERVKQRIVDSLACILGAYGSRPAKAAIAHAATLPFQASSVFGTNLRTSPDIAAFANGTMVRYLDYNDGYMSREPGHPSDNIPACLAVAEAEGASGSDLITAIVLAYEVQMRLQDAAGLNRRGWDHVNYILVSVAAAASRLMRLTERQTVQAINMALNGHIAMRQVRSGELSDWKGSSAANAARNAIFCAQLARHGMDGPSPIFEGRMGFIAQVSGDLDFDINRFGTPENGDFRILKSLTKTFPTNGELHTAVWAAIELKAMVPDLEEIAAIHIDTTDIGFRILASDPEKWRPATRETADHSLPYNVARGLMDGDITLASYAPAQIADPRAVALMSMTTVTEDPGLTALFPQHLANRVTVTLKSGEILTREVISGPGSVETPMNDADFAAKFRRMAADHIGPDKQDAALAFVRLLEQQQDYRPLFAAMRSTDAP
ncbi:MmgE/PrpD family protein [Niveispirillum irakense]|uniref:MmgE/PrpD family protein n=1 Tax=Niveispirillum irakense TaxID=34011 RepID=UPI000405F4CC|nr:MmgE/PrpD family protein [Niveispirillum irakense]